MRIFPLFIMCMGISLGTAYANVKVIQENGVENPKLLEPFKMRDWKANDKPGKDNIKNISTDEAKNLIGLMLAKEPDNKKPLPVIEFDVREITKDGAYELVAALGEHCLNCANQLVVVKNSEKGLSLYKFSTRSASVRWDIQDIKKDGTYEILVRNTFNDKVMGNDSYVSWIDIYRWKDGKFVMDDKSFPEFYKNTYLPQEKATIARFQSIIKDIGEGTGMGEMKDETLRKKKLASLNEGIEQHQAAITKVNKEILGM